MRLETPVIYFHFPKSGAGERGIRTLDVSARFLGGLLSEYFPDARAGAPGLRDDRFVFGPLRTNTVSSLQWNQLKIGGNWPFMKTADHVWLAPRAVEAESVQTTNSESEKFLFYRGVAHINAPLRIERDENNQLLFRSQLEFNPVNPLEVPVAWLVEIREQGIAFRRLPGFQLKEQSNEVLLRTPGTFTKDECRSKNLVKLRHEMREQLVQEGLFPDEADALLNTWELSYFKSPGLRVFFSVPREWTDHYLPLNFSEPVELKRVMVGRIELVTPEQRGLLNRLAAKPSRLIEAEAGVLKTNYMNRYLLGVPNQAQAQALAMERGKPLASLIEVPDSYATYLKLGRFRNALLLEAAARQPTPGLTNFIGQYSLNGYTIAP